MSLKETIKDYGSAAIDWLQYIAWGLLWFVSWLLASLKELVTPKKPWL